MEQAVFEELVFMDVEAGDAKELIRKIGAELEKNGYVKDTYVEAVVGREDEYPTGLQLADMAVAMPHTTGSHVNKPAVAVAKLKKPVTFAHMGDPDTKVEAEMVFMMAILDSSKQLELLQKVMKIFTNKEAMAELKAAETKQALFELAQKHVDA